MSTTWSQLGDEHFHNSPLIERHAREPHHCSGDDRRAMAYWLKSPLLPKQVIQNIGSSTNPYSSGVSIHTATQQLQTSWNRVIDRRIIHLNLSAVEKLGPFCRLWIESPWGHSSYTTTKLFIIFGEAGHDNSQFYQTNRGCRKLLHHSVGLINKILYWKECDAIVVLQL